MKTGTSQDTKADAFKSFPEFSKLTLLDRARYEALIAKYPPIDSISFATLMTWWDAMDTSAVSMLYGNLVISYWLPNMEQFSGLSIIGETKLDEAICAVFDHQKEKSEKPRLIQVPEFVVNNIEHPELFEFKSMREFDEYIMPVSTLFPLERAMPFKQKRIHRFLSLNKFKKVVVKSLDLSRSESRLLLLEAMAGWARHNKGNNFSKFSNENAVKALANHRELGVENLCLFIDDVLQGFAIYHYSTDRRYAIVDHMRMSKATPYAFEYVTYALCKWLNSKGVAFLNHGSDVGLSRLRTLKLGLGPTDYFRKYIIEPAAESVTM